MLLVMMAVVGVDLIIMAFYVNVEPTVLIFGLCTVFMMGAAFLSLGLFVSAMSSNQVTAGTLTFGFSLVLYVIGTLAGDLPKKNPAPEAWAEGFRNMVGSLYDFFRALVQQLAFDAHAKEMTQGVLRPEDITYYLLITAFFLFLTFRALESRKWRA